MRFHEREQTGLETYVGKKMRKGYVFDGWARLAASVIQHAFIEASDLCKQKNKTRISKKEKDSISANKGGSGEYNKVGAIYLDKLGAIN